MDRRRFLQIAGASILAGAGATVHAQAPVKKRSLKKAVNLGMVKAEGASVLDRFKIIKDAGFQGVELNRPDAIPMDELQKAKSETGIEIAGIICTTHWVKPLSDPDEKVREQGFKGLELALKDAGELGCARVLLVPGVVKKEVRYDDCWKRSQEMIKRAIPIAEAAKCKIAVENVWNQFLLSPMEAARYVDDLNSPWVGWHFDIGNVINYGWPEQWIRILGKRILNLHIKEFSRKRRDAEGLWKGFEVELGEGDVGWPDVMKALDEIGYQGYGIAEVKGGGVERMKFLSERIEQLYAA
jgi:L-ribulose-5-phosphate 3-epimerase